MVNFIKDWLKYKKQEKTVNHETVPGTLGKDHIYLKTSNQIELTQVTGGDHYLKGLAVGYVKNILRLQWIWDYF